MKTRFACAAALSINLLVLSHASAVPVMIDFTDARWSGAGGAASYSQMYGGLEVTVNASAGALSFNAGGPDADSALALHGDGLGIGDDEISFTGGESLNVSFSSGVTVLGYYLLDFFADEGPGGMGELARALFETDGGETSLLDVGTARDTVGLYGREGLDIGGTRMVAFSAAMLLDYASAGFSDFALAGILVDYEPVAVPAPGTLALLAAGLLGTLVARKRRSAPCAG